MLKEIFTLIWEKLTQISPSIFWASILFLVGIILSKIAEGIVVSFFKRIKMNKILERMGLKEALSKIDINIDMARFFGDMIKWFLITIFLMISSGILGLTDFSHFLRDVVSFFPNIFVAALIFVVCLLLTDFSQKVVIATLEKERITYSRFLGRTIRWIIWFFAILAILYQLKIAPSLILVVLIGMVFTISLALGIAFGFGGKELAEKILKEMEEKFK